MAQQTKYSRFKSAFLTMLVLLMAAPSAAHAQQLYVSGFKAMTMELTAFANHYILGLGKMFDAKQQLETEQKYRELNAQAHKDYYPSDMMCRFGTFVRSVAKTEASATANKDILNEALGNLYTNTAGSLSAIGSDGYAQSRLDQFKAIHCNVADNNGGQNLMCKDQSNPQPERYNKDIDYTRTLAQHLTLDANYTDQISTPDEQDIYALAQHLYWTKPFPTLLAKNMERYKGTYQNARRLTAMQNIAHNSFTTIVGMKSAAERGAGAGSGWNFMKGLMREFGMNETQINEDLGEFPSYYAQMEVLTKKMYQNPNFYTNLYDKPTNVRRISASMEAIKLMQARDQFKTSLRREMLLAMMIEDELADDFKAVADKLKE